MSQGLKAQLKNLIAAKEYRAAIVLLKTSDLPDKATYIARIEQRIRDDVKAQATTDDDTLKSLIASGKYAEARALLQRIDHPKKDVMLAELNRRLTGESATVKPLPGTGEAPAVKAKSYNSGGCAYMARLLAFTIVAIPVIFLIGHVVNSHINRVQWRMEDVCRTVYWDYLLADEITSNQWFNGCKAAATRAIDIYGEEVAFCFANENGTERRFIECLDEEEVYISLSTIKETAP